jgi:ATP phosphoribosyltransferase regulatory subunit
VLWIRRRADALHCVCTAVTSRLHPGILQPAEPFLDLSGEDIRKSLYLTTDASGEERLRPDLTIPARAIILPPAAPDSPQVWASRAGVPVSRRTAERILQAGIESSAGRPPAADAEMLALALEATRLRVEGWKRTAMSPCSPR